MHANALYTNKVNISLCETVTFKKGFSIHKMHIICFEVFSRYFPLGTHNLCFGCKSIVNILIAVRFSTFYFVCIVRQLNFFTLYQLKCIERSNEGAMCTSLKIWNQHFTKAVYEICCFYLSISIYFLKNTLKNEDRGLLCHFKYF